MRWLSGRGGLLAFVRRQEDEQILCAANAGSEPAELALDGAVQILLGEGEVQGKSLVLPPRSCVIARL